MIPRVGSAFLTLSVTIERYMAISQPLYLDRSHLKFILITVSTLLAILYNIPRLERFLLLQDLQESFTVLKDFLDQLDTQSYINILEIVAENPILNYSTPSSANI